VALGRGQHPLQSLARALVVERRDPAGQLVADALELAEREQPRTAAGARRAGTLALSVTVAATQAVRAEPTRISAPTSVSTSAPRNTPFRSISTPTAKRIASASQIGRG